MSFGILSLRPFCIMLSDFAYLLPFSNNFPLKNSKSIHKAPFTIGARPLYNTLRSKYFSFARPVAYVARSLAFVASVLVVASSRIRIVDMHIIQMRPNAIKIIAMQRTTVRTNMLHVIVQRFTIIARFISFNLPCCATSMYTMYTY